MGKRGRPRLSSAPFRYRATSAVRKGTELHSSDRNYIKAVFALPPDLERTWWFVRQDGRIDRRLKRWFLKHEVIEWRRYVEDYVNRELNR